MNELIHLRNENSKTHELGGGKRRCQISIGAVHYKDNYADKSEQWKDINLIWEGNRITKAPYELTHEGNKLTLKNKRTGNITTIELDSIGGKKIPDVAWERSKGLARAPGIVTIEDVVLDTDLEVIAEFSAVKFRRVIKSDKAPQEAKFKVTGDTSLLVVSASDEDGDMPVESSLKDGILTETLKPDRAIKYPVRIDPTWQVGTGSDDVWRKLTFSDWGLSETWLQVGRYSASDKQSGIGMRFTNITIPQGATIENGTHLTIWANQSDTATTVNTRISAEDVDDAPTFADNAAAFDARWANRTEARVDWDDIEGLTEGLDFDSPEIKTVIQEIINRGGWNSGQDIVIFWEDFEDRSTGSDARRIVESYEGSVEFAPKLVIEYTLPVGLDNKSANMGSKMVAAGLI